MVVPRSGSWKGRGRGHLSGRQKQLWVAVSQNVPLCVVSLDCHTDLHSAHHVRNCCSRSDRTTCHIALLLPGSTREGHLRYVLGQRPVPKLQVQWQTFAHHWERGDVQNITAVQPAGLHFLRRCVSDHSGGEGRRCGHILLPRGDPRLVQ